MPLLLETSGYPTAHAGRAFSCGCWAWGWGAFSWGKHRQEVSSCTVSVIIWASETQPPSQEQEASWQDKLQAHVRVGGVEGRYRTMSHVRRVGGCQWQEGKGWGRPGVPHPYRTSNKCGLPWYDSTKANPSWGWHSAGWQAQGSVREPRR